MGSRGLVLKSDQIWTSAWRYAIAAALVLAFGATLYAQGMRFSILKEDAVLKRLQTCPAKDIEREHQLQTFFSEAGCVSSALVVETPKHSQFGNVICTLPGSTQQEIVVGAHFDHVPEGAGVVDNWSGASLLPSIYQVIAHEPRTHTFVFVGFYGEEEGMVGSEHYVKELSKPQLAQIDAMVNMDTLGLGPTEIWASHADKRLAGMAIAMSRAMKLPLTIMNVEQAGSTDSESFRLKKVPSITFHSLTQSTLHILHSSSDQLSQIKDADYYDSYKLISAYLLYLDGALDAGPRPGKQSK